MSLIFGQVIITSSCLEYRVALGPVQRLICPDVTSLRVWGDLQDSPLGWQLCLHYEVAAFILFFHKVGTELPHSFERLRRVPLCGCAIIYVPTALLEHSTLFPNLGCYQQGCKNVLIFDHMSVSHIYRICVYITSHTCKCVCGINSLQWNCSVKGFVLFFLRFCLFLERWEGREEEGEKPQCVRDTSISCLLQASSWGPGPQPRHVPWLGIELGTFLFSGWRSIHWATPVRVGWCF